MQPSQPWRATVLRGLWLRSGLGWFDCRLSGRLELGQMQAELSLHTSKGRSSQTVATHVVCSHWGKVLNRRFWGGLWAGRTTEERIKIWMRPTSRSGVNEPFVLDENRVRALTVLQSQCRTISATVHRSPGLRRTVVRIWRRELMEDGLKITMWDLILLQWLLDNYSRHSEPHFPVMKPLTGLWVFVHLPPAPFQNALKPSSLRIFLKQSMTPLYVVWPARAATWSLVLMTSAGVTSEAAGIP